MAFLRFRRDKRGYEHFYLVEPTTTRRGKVRAHVLYWFRTPPNVKVGREPFDPELRRALEASHPQVAFDWRMITEAPIPSADSERWRERLRAERAQHPSDSAAQSSGEDQPSLAEPPPESAPAELAPSLGEPSEPVSVPPSVSSPVPLATRRRRRRRRRRRGNDPPGQDAARLCVAAAPEPAAEVLKPRGDV